MTRILIFVSFELPRIAIALFVMIAWGFAICVNLKLNRQKSYRFLINCRIFSFNRGFYDKKMLDFSATFERCE